MTKESHDERMAEAALEKQSDSGHPKKSAPSVESTMPPGMKKPVAPGEEHMGGIHKGMEAGGEDKHMGNTSMKSATRQLEYETERGEHAPEVGGHHDAGHHHAGGLMKKA